MKYYILNPDPDINSLCASLLDETCFASAITVFDSNGRGKQYSAWEVTRKQLQEIRQSAKDKNIPLQRFEVCVLRKKSKETPRIAQKGEYIQGYNSRNKRPERLRKILAERKAKRRSC